MVCRFPFFTYPEWLTQEKAIYPNWRFDQLPKKLRPKYFEEHNGAKDIELSIHYHLAPLIFPDVTRYLGTWEDDSPQLVVMAFQEFITPRDAQGILVHSVVARPTVYWCGDKGCTTFQIRCPHFQYWGACMLGIAPLRPEAELILETSDKVRINKPFAPGEDTFFMRTIERFGILKKDLPKEPKKPKRRSRMVEPLF